MSIHRGGGEGSVALKTYKNHSSVRNKKEKHPTHNHAFIGMKRKQDGRTLAWRHDHDIPTPLCQNLLLLPAHVAVCVFV